MKKTIIYSALLLGYSLLTSAYDLPKGWFKAGSAPDKYEMGIDRGKGRNGGSCATIKSGKNKISGFGTLMQTSLPDKYLGKRVRMTGYMKSEDVNKWAGFWLRVDQAGSSRSIAFDNMSERPVKGTTDWKKYEIVLDVSIKASNIAFGALIGGTGQIWFDEMEFEIVDQLVPVTGTGVIHSTEKPSNLNFEE